mgnify:CR=1 FL=1
MKKSLLSLCLAGFMLSAANSQIVIDGNMSDWNSVPILSEPGVYPYTKTISNATDIYYLVSLDAANAFNTNAGPGLELYVDADFSSATGQKSDWLYVSSGNDYFIQGLSVHNYIGTPGANEWDWNWVVFRDGNRAFSSDVRTIEQKLLISDLTAIPLSEKYSMAFGYYYSTNEAWEASGYIPGSDAGFAQRKSFTIKSRTEVALSTAADFTSTNAYYHPFMNDANIAEYLDFQSGTSATENPKHWASWALNLVTPGVYEFKMTTKSSGSGQAQLSLINMSTNELVKTFTSVNYPTNTDMTENTYGTLDLSDVPSGKYMLKLMNPTTTDTNLKVGKITLSNTSATSYNTVGSEGDIQVSVNSNMLHITLKEQSDVSIYTMNGQQVSDFSRVTSISEELNSGIYMVVVRINEKQFFKKVLLR